MRFQALSLAAALAIVARAPADQFHQYTRGDLAKIIASPDVAVVTDLNAATIVAHSGVIPRTEGAFLIAQTNDGSLAKLLVQAGRQKIGNESAPILVIDRFVTFQDKSVRAVKAAGRDIRLFGGFQYSLDIGQVVPEKIGGELLVMAAGGQLNIQPLGRAKLYLVLKAPRIAPPLKSPSVGEAFESKYMAGRYKLYDDGRRTGLLTLRVDPTGAVTGSYTSDTDGQKYDVEGRVGAARHAIAFTIQFPIARQSFQGFAFTGNAKAIAGITKLADREAGFYAVRVE